MGNLPKEFLDNLSQEPQVTIVKAKDLKPGQRIQFTANGYKPGLQCLSKSHPKGLITDTISSVSRGPVTEVVLNMATGLTLVAKLDYEFEVIEGLPAKLDRLTVNKDYSRATVNNVGID